MPRKTFAVEDFKEAANRMLASPDSFSTAEDAKSQRLGVCGLIEHVLFATGNYKGFRHLDSEWDAEAWALREGYDDTRRMYI